MDNGLARQCGPKTHPRSLPGHCDMAVTEIRCDNLLPEMNGPIRQEDVFLVALHLRGPMASIGRMADERR
jgi:hypothetical protein